MKNKANELINVKGSSRKIDKDQRFKEVDCKELVANLVG